MSRDRRLARTLCALGALCAITAAPARAQTAAEPAKSSPVTVGGVVYAQYLYQLRDTAGHANNFDVTRAYLTVSGKLSGGLSTRVTADIFRDDDGSLAYRLKYAYFSYAPHGSALAFKLGQMHTPLIEWEETLWEYRMQGRVALDRAGYETSSDFGAGVDGSWHQDAVNMQAGIYNGEGYNKAPGDKRKDVMARMSLRLAGSDDSSRVGGLRLTGYAHVGKPTGGGRRNRLLGMLSYRSKLFTLAAEYARLEDRLDNPPLPAVPDDATTTGRIVSAFGVFHVPRSRAALIGRMDVTDPDTHAADDRQTRLIAGVSWQLTPNLRLLADVDHVSYEGGPTPAEYAEGTQGLFQVQVTF